MRNRTLGRLLGAAAAAAVAGGLLATTSTGTAGAATTVDMTGTALVFNPSGSRPYEAQVGNGRNAGDRIVYRNVATVSSVVVDAVVTTVSVTNMTVDTYDATDPGSASTSADNFQIDTSPSANSSVVFRFDFYVGGTYTGPGTGEPAELRNVMVTSIDIDGPGRQFTDFTGFQTYQFATTTNLQAVDMGGGVTRFRPIASPSTNRSDVAADRVQVTFDAMHTYTATFGNEPGGTSYFGLTFRALCVGASNQGSCVAAAPVGNPSNRPPTANDTTKNVTSGVPTLVELTDFGTYADPDANPLAKVRITTLPATGQLEVDTGSGWQAVAAGTDIAVDTIADGRLRYTGTSVDSLQFQVNDGLLYSTATYTMDLVLLPPTTTTAPPTTTTAAPPTTTTAAPPTTTAAPPTTTTAPVPVAVDDTVTAPAGAIVLVDAIANDTPHSVVVVSHTATTDAQVEIVGGKLRVTPALGFSGTITFDYTISDGVSTSTATVTVIVTPPSAALATELFYDTDGDGSRGSAEPGVPGVTMTIELVGRPTVVLANGATSNGVGDSVAGDVLGTYTCRTTATGTCTATGLPVGRYRVAAVYDAPGAGVVVSADPDGAGDLVAVAGATTTGTGTVSFGVQGPGSLSGRAYVTDDERQGYKAGVDRVLPDAVVHVVWAGPDGTHGTADDVVFPVTTAEDGTYSAEGLPAGAYEVRVPADSLPEGTVAPEVLRVEVLGVTATRNADIALRQDLPASLAYTGASTGPLVGGALAFIASGIVALAGSRRRRVIIR